MTCVGCGFDNPPGMKYCGGCGASLGTTCPGCGVECVAGHRFCGRCGTALPGADASAEPAIRSEPPAENSGERRYMTVMFCDLVGSTALSETLDPEDLRDLLTRYQTLADEAVRKYEGSIAKFLGDGVLVYFGYPQAHEDDAVRAVKAGLEIIERIPEMNEAFRHALRIPDEVEVKVRMGIHTGLVVVGDMRTQSFSETGAIVGQTPNIAARIEGVAQSNGIVVSADTLRLVRNHFDTESLGERSLKGVSKPIEVFRIIGAVNDTKPDDEITGGGVTPLVGRIEEAEFLIELWTRVCAGEGQVAAISGEAGIGKSRLIRALQDRLRNAAHIRLRCQSSPYFRGTALHPIREMLGRQFYFEHSDDARTKREKLRASLIELDLENEMRALSRFLGIDDSGHQAAAEPSPERQRVETLNALLALVGALEQREPVLIVVEDLHWLDATSLELIERLIKFIESKRVMMVVTHRPEFEPGWNGAKNVNAIRLNRLSQHEASAFIAKLTGGRNLPSALMREVLEKTDGVPLFIEELIKMVLESQMLEEHSGQFVVSGASLNLEIPGTLQESLRARLDRLDVDPSIIQTGAAIGRSFNFGLLAMLATMSKDELQDVLGKLVTAGVFYERGVPPHSEYVFRHALVQDAAYQSMLKSRRQKVHQQIAQTLQAQFPELAESEPEVMAKHYTEAGAYEDAIRYWRRAGRQALSQSAHVEAVSHFKRGIDLIRALDESPKRVESELMLQSLLGNALMSTRGYGAPEVERAYKRAWKLCQKAEVSPQWFNIQFGLWGYYLIRGEIETAAKVGQECETQAQNLPIPYLHEQIHFVRGHTHFWMAEFQPAQDHLEAGVEIFDEEFRRDRALPAVQDPSVGARSVLALVLWMRGKREAARQKAEEALALAEQLHHPFSEAFALGFGGILYQLDEDVEKTLEVARRGVALSAEQGFSFYLALCVTVEGWALYKRGFRERGLARMEEGLDGYAECGANLGRPYLEAVYGACCIDHGSIDRGREALTHAEKDMHERGGHYYHSEVYRMQAEAALAHPEIAEWLPEPLLRRAVEIANEYGAAPLRQRAADQLERILGHGPGKPVEPRPAKH